MLPNTTFRQLLANEEMPYQLLLLADPSKKIIDKYLKKSTVFITEIGTNLIGVAVLLPISSSEIEIKNIAVLPEMQGKGIGKFLLGNSFNYAIKNGFETIMIGTANSSTGQLYLYQKQGFEIYETQKDFFIKNYPEAIYENGLQAIDMIMLRKKL
jgi:ribosomal protein S18 acetylase RimI-like enzyme